MAKIRSISPFNPAKYDAKGYDRLHNLDKRIAAQIDAGIRVKLNETFFLGYYIDGGYVGVNGNSARFKSPIDDYQYTQNQVKYIWSLFSTRLPPALNDDGTAFVNGQLKKPALPQSNSGAGNLYWLNFVVDQDDGSVTCQVSYFIEGGAETITNDGILAVFALCQRSLPK